MQDKAAFDPDNRALYTALFRAPEGYAFDCAATTTYSLDFETALAVLMAMAADDTVEREAALAQPLSLLHAIQRLSKRIAIYCDRGRILRAPARIAPLMALCENMIVEVAAKEGGAFHPKLWCVRFTGAGKTPDHLRLGILSRNLTPDRSWDLSLMLDGVVGTDDQQVNAPLVAMMKALPGMAVDGTAKKGRISTSLAKSLLKCRWDLPLGASKVSFAVNGVKRAGPMFALPKGDRLAILSPFVTERGLDKLREGMRQDSVCHLVSRAMELDKIPEATLKPFTVRTMDNALSDGGSEAVEGENATSLHAKAMLVETETHISVCVGSANATTAALIPDRKDTPTRNVEVMATLSGTRRRMGGIDDILLCEPFTRMLDCYTSPDEEPMEDERAAIEERLDDARRVIATLKLEINCTAEGEAVVLTLQMAEGQPRQTLPEGITCFMQMLAARPGDDRDAAPVLTGKALPLGLYPLSDLTRWIGVRLRHDETGTECAFTLGATLIDVPAEREAAALRAIIDTNSFLTYIALLLGHADDGGAWEPGLEGAEGRGERFIFERNDSLLEPMVRALCRGGDELAHVSHLIDALRDPETGDSAVPEDFLDLWQAFAPLAKKGRS